MPRAGADIGIVLCDGLSATAVAAHGARMVAALVTTLGPGRTDAERNCVSNIHPPDGLGYAHAARVVATLVEGARRLSESGVRLKDTSREHALKSGVTRPQL